MDTKLIQNNQPNIIEQKAHASREGKKGEWLKD